MKSELNATREFLDVYKVKPLIAPDIATQRKEWQLQYRLIEEELDEYWTALNDKDETEIFDALLDITYLALNGMQRHGFTNEQIMQGFQEVHRSNMSKLDADGKPIFREDGKVAKSDLYTPPNLKAILNNNYEK